MLDGRPASLASLAIAAGVMSGVPTISSWPRFLCTVSRPLTPITIEVMPNAIRIAAATTPPISKSYEAKAHGVRTGMGGALARRLCPDAVVVEPRMSAYAEASKAIYRVFEDTTPAVEGVSIDEAFLDVRGVRRLSGSPLEVAARLRREVRMQVGLPITVGVARTKFLAK